ncbi:MAG: L-2-amino-thiazoline-4-carboxylic acid hydrolase [Desulfobacter sp.]
MKNQFRLFIGFLVATPIALLTLLVSLFTGKQRAISILGPKVTIVAKSAQQFFPPKISNASEFELFKTKLKDKQKIWSVLYDYPIEFPDENTAKLVVKNCPFAEAVIKLNICEFGYYMCQGDWEVAKDNSDKWEFERRCTIATGGTLCDFTYKRIKNEN